MSMDLYCPNCGNYMGKQIEMEYNLDGETGKTITIWCDRCGQPFKHRCIY